MSIKLSPVATYGALKRKVTNLRQKVSDYDRETSDMKRVAERQGGPAARFAVDAARSAGFAKLRERLRIAEVEYVKWRPAQKAPQEETSFASIMQAQIDKRGSHK